MNLVDRHLVEGSAPPVYIGHRQYVNPRTKEAKVCRPWYAEWNEQGAKRHQPLKTTNKQVAIRSAHDLCRRIAAGELSREAVVRVNTTLPDLVTAYMIMIKGMKRAPKTVVKYQQVLNDMVKHAEKSRVRLARQYTNTIFWSLSQQMIDGELADKTRYNQLTIVKQLFRWAAAEKFIPANPLVGAKLDEPEPTEQYCFTGEEVGRILAASDDRNRAIFLFLAYTGARFGEAAALEWDDLQFEKGGKGWVNIQRGGSDGKTKSGRSRRIPMHPSLHAVLKDHPRHPETPRVFQARLSAKHPTGAGPIDARRMLTAIKRLCKLLKFPHWKRCKLHTFRHFFASSLAAAQVSYRYALDFMGHTDSEILNQYYKRFDPVAEQAILQIIIPSIAPDDAEVRKEDERREAA